MRAACTASASRVTVVRCATHTAKTNGSPVQRFHSRPRSYTCAKGTGTVFVPSISAASPMTSRASHISLAVPIARRSEASASPRMKTGVAFHTCANSISSKCTLVIELRLTRTLAPLSSVAGFVENNMTLRTGPSHEIARSGSRR